MKREVMRIACAEILGWTKCRLAIRGAGAPERRPSPHGIPPGKNYEAPLPDYPASLDAMHEAWSSLKDYDKREFHVQLGLIIEKETKNWDDLQLLDQRGLIANATALQRLKAFLRVHGVEI